MRLELAVIYDYLFCNVVKHVVASCVLNVTCESLLEQILVFFVFSFYREFLPNKAINIFSNFFNERQKLHVWLNFYIKSDVCFKSGKKMNVLFLFLVFQPL